MFSTFGFMEGNQFSFDILADSELQNSDKRVKLLHQLLKDVSILIFNDLMIDSPEEFKMKLIQQAFVSQKKVTETSANNFIEDQQLHNDVTFHQYYEQIANKINV